MLNLVLNLNYSVNVTYIQGGPQPLRINTLILNFVPIPKSMLLIKCYREPTADSSQKKYLQVQN